ncbi:hypothetical protein [Methanoregula sp.]|uniref:hypothetical protein n=1 Tax=Methanoregula sp. TaxID=2052170 RepID=UPI002B6FCB80|nr:hypothetical protein [Methanoregula sp.]HVP96935.1 hypothetical protein [Methanoregula sp.]
MSQIFTFIALCGLALAALFLLLYFRQEDRDVAGGTGRQPLPGRLFIPILVACTLLGMAITEWQGVCHLSPWGFVTGIILGAAAELAAYRHRKRTGIP